ncbi:double-strand break repair helicase AddA [Caulobacter sp. S45]|uniref:double-strand break repair helicase AddA n=1 Tax=Caulobacter sp. S45 TaxID=1641861 RepID=UPI0015760F9B|nr:double-strand break repair helicase AddA [Caulobacter sp. S45]
MSLDPQITAADPFGSAFVSANAGSGKTKTLVDRVARLLLHGARPEAILCVTYTKAAAAEMQRRLFQQLGDWSMLDNGDLTKRLAAIGENARDLPRARTLFARALEAPGGLKIQTLHAFCEKLLRRFPLEAGVSPGFKVMDDAAAAEVGDEARDALARVSMAGQAQVAAAYAAMASSLDFQSFESMFAVFQARREAIGDYIDRIGGLGALEEDAARACGLDGPVSPEALEGAAVAPPVLDLGLWRAGAAALSASGVRDQKCAAQMAQVAEAAARGQARFSDALAVFCTGKGEPAKWVDTASALKRDPALQLRLAAERDRLLDVAAQVKAARVAQASLHALTLASVYVDAFQAVKTRRGLLDFTDLVTRAKALLRDREDAAWVLYKLDGGVDHVLLDEAQDTAPEQWEILRALTGEFFSGAGAPGRPDVRTVFIVGDEKQSIYSFQGAQPERLAQEADRYEGLAAGVEHRFSRVPLLESWRSTPQVLGFVDAVFAPHGAALQPRAGADAAVELVRHIARRTGDHGTIDLWEVEREEPLEDRRAWDAPLDAEGRTGAYRRLAERIAGEIARLVGRGEQVHDKALNGHRPAEYGDVLILVRKRKALFAELLRACKHAGVPVAGADRLRLSEHPVFEDLLALTRVALFPHDDLTLAAVLRSPLCDVDEDSLYVLARGPGGSGRPGKLWTELSRRAGERVDWRAALELIGWTRAQASEPPFALYSRLFSRLDTAGRSIRQRFVTRLGSEAGDALDEVLAQALAAEGRGVRDLERFADQVARLDITVKREMDAPREPGQGGEVRIMTAHSAKGLEAPIVFLPETVTGGAPRGSPLLETPEGGFLWCASKTGDCAASGRVRGLREAREAQEALRLLYVALTRARDRVVIAGRVNARADIDKVKGWWGPMRDAFEHPSLAGQVRDLELDGREVRRFGPDPVATLHPPRFAGAEPDLPAWLHRFAPQEAALDATAPSGAAPRMHGPAPSPLSQSFGLGRFRRGELIHRLLQLLPDLDPQAWDGACARLLDKERDLDPAQRAEMAEAALGVLRDARFAEVFGPGSRAEAAVAGAAPDLPPGYAVSGRVDRMVITPERVLVADFKTNRPSPNRIEEADPAYITQIAIYVAVLRAVFPGRAVEAALVWTDGPKLMVVPENMMREALRALGGTRA